MPDGRGADDAGRVVAEGLVVGVADPHRRRQAGGEAHGPVVLEVVGGAGLRRDRPAGEGEVAVATELEAAVTVVRHDRGDDEGDAVIDGAELILLRVVGKHVLSKPILDVENGRLAMADSECRQR